jgi:hypothetical protein
MMGPARPIAKLPDRVTRLQARAPPASGGGRAEAVFVFGAVRLRFAQAMHRPAPAAASRTGCATPATIIPDLALGLVIVAGTLVYLPLWPHDVRCVDEGLFLYEATRLLHGDRFYRDLFEFITPGSYYAMAGVFWLFGASIETARMAMAWLHAAIGLGIFAVCRALGVRRTLALAAAAAHLAFGFVGWPVASPHWFSALLALGLLGMCLSERWRQRPFVVGVVAGCLIAVQQHKGALFGAGAGLVLAGAALWERDAPRSAARCVGAIAAYAAGLVAVTAAVGAALVYSAGAGAVYGALVAFPLGGYSQFNQRPGGLLDQLFTAPAAVRYLPLIGIVSLLAGVRAARSGDADRARRDLTLAVFSGSAFLATVYYLDYAHLAVVAPIWLVAVAVMLETGLRRAAAVAPRLRTGGAVATWALLGVLGWRLAISLPPAAVFMPVQTRFGRVDLAEPDEVSVVEAVTKELASAPERELFAYPLYPWLFLMVGAKNATRYQILVPGYNSPEQMREVLAQLTAAPPPIAVVQAYFVKWNDDPVIKALEAGFQRVPLRLTAPWPAYALFRRRTGAEQAPPPAL